MTHASSERRDAWTIIARDKRPTTTKHRLHLMRKEETICSLVVKHGNALPLEGIAMPLLNPALR